MPQFAANLGFLFQEVDMLARYNAAAGAGFRGVETPFPYTMPPEAFAARLQTCGLEQVLCNLPPATGTLVSVALALCRAGKRPLLRVSNRL